jgi:hypothetical protein
VNALPGSWSRALQLVRQPRATWALLAQAQPGTGRVFFGFLVPLMVPALVASVVGLAAVGLTTDGFSYKLSWREAVQHVGLASAAALSGLWWMSVAAQRLAPVFQAKGPFSAAWSAVVHAGTPLYLASLVMVFPAVGRYAPLALLACIPLLHLGLEALLRPADRRAVPYTAAVVGAGVLWWLLLSVLSSCATKSVQALEVFEVIQQAVNAGPTMGTGSRKRVSPETLDDGKGGSGQAPVGKGGAGSGDLELEDAGLDALVGEGLGMGAGANPPTRTVLQDFLPEAPADTQREVVDSYAFIGPRDTAAGALMHGAFTNAKYVPKTRGQPIYRMTITDLTEQWGPQVEDLILTEVAQTGGESEQRNGKVKRRISEEGARFIITQFEDHPNPKRRLATVEWLIARRYKVVAESEGLSLEELMTWAQQVDLAALEERAKAGKPVE